MVSIKKSSSKKIKLDTKPTSAKVIKKKAHTKLSPSANEKIVKLITKKPDQENSNKKKKTKYVMPSKFITNEVIENCLLALEKLAAASVKKNAIFNDESQIFLEINCIKIQNDRRNIKL